MCCETVAVLFTKNKSLETVAVIKNIKKTQMDSFFILTILFSVSALVVDGAIFSASATDQANSTGIQVCSEVRCFN